MSDDFSSKNGKVKVMYVRADSDPQKQEKKDHGRDKYRTEKTHRWGGDKPNKPVRKSKERPARSPWQAKLQDASDLEEQSSVWTNSEKQRPQSVDVAQSVESSHSVESSQSVDLAQLRRQREEETKVYGENACLEFYKQRPDSLVRAYFLQEVTPKFRDALKWMASKKLAYHVVDIEEMNRYSGSEHHGGVCFLIKKKQTISVFDYVQNTPEKDCVIAIDKMGNPYNLGGIMRTAAHFGVQGLMLRDIDNIESGAAIRTAEGGVEHLTAIKTDDFAADLAFLQRSGYKIISLTRDKGRRFSNSQLPEKSVLVLTDDKHGLPKNILPLIDMSLSFNGSGAVENLNISVVTGIALSDWWKVHKS